MKSSKMAKGPMTTRRDDLLKAAREAFERGGQAAVEVVPVCTAAGVTTGVLYHSFGSRQGLLRAVLEDVAALVAERTRAVMSKEKTPWARLQAGVREVLDCCLEPLIRNAYNEAPSIVGLDEWRTIEEAKTGVLLVETLFELQAAGQLQPLALPVLAAMLKGAIVEGAMAITRAEKPALARKEAQKVLDLLLASVRAR
jgi:AcrR family transcriptional regulator